MKQILAGRSSHILVFIGPSGVGKSTIVSRLNENGLLSLNPTWTTRPSRFGETNGVEHTFVPEEELERARKSGMFLEVVQLFGLPFYYGQPKVILTPGKVPSMMLRVGVLEKLSQHYDNFTVYQIEDEKEKVEKRLRKRASNGELIGTRLDDYTKELEAGRRVANRVFHNCDLDSIAAEITKAILEDFPEYRP